MDPKTDNPLILAPPKSKKQEKDMISTTNTDKDQENPLKTIMITLSQLPKSSEPATTSNKALPMSTTIRMTTPKPKIKSKNTPEITRKVHPTTITVTMK